MAAAREVSSSAIVPEVLNKDNYKDWSVRVKTYLEAKDLWAVVEATNKPPKENHGEVIYKAWVKNNAEALHAIQISCGPDTFHLIRDQKTAKTAWDALKAQFQPVLENNETQDQGSEEITEENVKLFNALRNNKWNDVKDILDKNADAIRAKITYSRRTALHVATSVGHMDIVENLVKMMKEPDLEIKGSDGKTALVIAINKDNKRMVECMVTKNARLLSITDRGNRIPVVLAYRNGYWKLASYLYFLTLEKDPDLMSEKRLHGATLISESCYAKKFELACHLIQKFPKLGTAEDIHRVSPLYSLASVPSAFRSGTQLNFWQRWIYDRIENPASTPANNNNCVGLHNHESVQDSSVRAQDHISVDVQSEEMNQKDTIFSCLSKRLVRKFRHFSAINDIYEMKLIHEQSTKILKRMCEQLKYLNQKDMKDGLVTKAIFRAVEQGIPEFIQIICTENKELVWSTDEKRRSIFHYAIECRQENIYNLIHPLEMKEAIANFTDKSNNNMLHMAALLSPVSQLNQIRGAALQMQRELQWFKEVESIVPKKAIEIANWTDNMRPRDLFSQNHKMLRKDAETWMKETATSFTVVGALIITIMFATAFTIPGGYNGDTGIPILLNKRLFMVFIISDAISLCSATTSSLMFLGIYTSRYAEDDFLKWMPTNIVIAFFTLFFSIVTMMVAFCAALLLLLQQKPWTESPIIILCSIPVTLFVLMKIPLLVEILVCTYGTGIFNKNVKPWL